jgi:DNA-binding winged helix-turn-helix (wHTH) protein/tetratricopeptide (TPR) repeat protein
VEFEEFVVDPAAHTLRRGEAVLSLRPKSFATLAHLVRRAGELVTKEELLHAIWPDVAVGDAVLKVCIRELREALGDNPKEPRFIETRHRIGYRFVAPVRRAASAGSSAPTPRAPHEGELFVGRTRELATLDELLGRALRGESGPRVVLVSGEAGFGKTALVEAFARQASGRADAPLWTEGACVERHGLAEPFFPFLEGLSSLVSSDRRIREIVRATAPTWCLHIPAVFPRDARLRDETLGATRPRLLRELADLLRAVAAERPLVWVLEDMHWADPSSIDLLRHIGSFCAGEPLLVVATYRPSALTLAACPIETCLLELASHARSVAITLGPLSRDDVAAYVSVALGALTVSGALVDFLAARTEGHPLFLTSLVRHLVEIGGIRRDTEGALEPALSTEALRSEVPANVHAMVERKLATIDAESRRVLSFASIQGVELLSDVLAELLDEDAARVEEQLDRLFRLHRILNEPVDATIPGRSPAQRYRFAHVLYHDALLAGVVPSRRVELHRRTAAALERRAAPALEEIAGTLAYHYEAGHEPAQALHFLSIWAENAERRLALAEAEAACDRAIALTQRLSDRDRAVAAARFHRRRAGLRMAAGRFAEVAGEIAEMRRWAQRGGDIEMEIDALMLTFRQLGYMARFDEAEAVADEALAVARGVPGHERAIAANLAGLRGVRGDLAAASDALSEALRESGDAIAGPTRAAATLDLASYLSMQGRHHEALRWLDDLLPLARDLGDALRVGAGLLWRAHALANQARAGNALRALEDGIRLSCANDDGLVLPRLLACAGWLHRELGAFDLALTWDARALDLGPRLMPDVRAHVLIDRALNRIGLGEPRAADDPLHEAEALVASPCFGDWLVRVRVSAARARQALAAGDGDALDLHARTLAACAEAHALEKPAARARLLLAEAALKRGDTSRVAGLLDQLAATFARVPLPLIEWRAFALRKRLRLALGDEAGAEDAERRGVAVAGRIMDGAPRELAAPFRALCAGEGLCLPSAGGDLKNPRRPSA